MYVKWTQCTLPLVPNRGRYIRCLQPVLLGDAYYWFLHYLECQITKPTYKYFLQFIRKIINMWPKASQICLCHFRATMRGPNGSQIYFLLVFGRIFTIISLMKYITRKGIHKCAALWLHKYNAGSLGPTK